MYGLVFEIIEEFVIEKHGLEVWHSIKANAGCEVKDQAFLRRSYYPDNELFDIIVATSEVLGVAVPAILEVFGHFVVRHHYLNGYNDLMRAQGSTLRKWLSNLNAMHDHVQKSFPGKEFSAPIFWCEDCEDVEGSILLHYFSLRGVMLVPMCVGIIEELASFQFDLEVKMTRLALQGEDGAEFTTWRITAVDPSQRSKLSPPTDEVTVDFSRMEMPTKCPFTGTDLTVDDTAGKCPYSSKSFSSFDKDKSEETASTVSMVSTAAGSGKAVNGITLAKMQSVFPFHVLVDQRFTIVQVGETLPTLLRREAEEIVGKHIGEVLDITRPVLGSAWDWQSLKKLSDQNFFLAPASKASSTKRRVSMADTQTKFTGSMIVLDGYVMFALSPDVRNVVELRNMGLTMTDLPLHGCQRDAVFLGEYIAQETEKAHKLDQLSKKLENEKNLSNTLLYNMLPKHIADDLRRGKTVEPQHHENVTLFFSDIEGFTGICDKVDPWAVIVMLNKLYSVMDHLAAHFNLYKIETVGDAYMCCSGLPFADEYHAENIANFAVAVVECVKHVLSPIDNTPVRLRIGVHTGQCTAGVVGTLTPHYCLFGDMVNTTARHEQTGIAGKIQVSSDLYGRLKFSSTFDNEQFVLTPRGLVSMKGKAERATYWLESGTTENEKGGPAAIQALSEEVHEMLEKKSWKMRRYFRRSGALRGMDDSMMDDQSMSSSSTDRTQYSQESEEEEKRQGSKETFDDRRESTFSHTNIPCLRLHSSDANDSLSENDNEDIEGFEAGSQAGFQTERSLDFLDALIADEDPAGVVQNGLSKLVWDSSLSREDFVSTIHILLSPVLKLCLLDEATGQFPDTMDLLDGQLYGLIDHVSKSFKQNRFHNLRRTAHVVAWAIHLFERVQDSGAGMSGSVDNGPWFRFTLAIAALIQDCKHSGVSDDQLQAEKHMVHEMHGGMVKYALNYVTDVFAEDFTALYDEVTWRFPSFLRLLRSTALSTDVVGAFDKAMRSSNDHSPRALTARTEATMGLVLRMASLGHFALEFDNFIEWNEAAFAQKRIASLARRGNNPVPVWHEQCVLFLKHEVLPVVEQCETVLPKTERLRDTVALNLKNFEAQGKPWQDIQYFQPQSSCEGPVINPAATVDVFC